MEESVAVDTVVTDTTATVAAPAVKSVLQTETLHAMTPGVLLVSLVYAVLGMVFLMIAYKIFDLVNALEFTKELGKNNQALGTTIGGFFIAMAIIIAAAIHG